MLANSHDGTLSGPPQTDHTKASIPNIAQVVGPALQAEITEANRAILRLYVAAARLRRADPLSPSLLGVSETFLDTLIENVAGRETLLASALGFPLFELKIKDEAILKSIIQDGVGSSGTVAELTKHLPLPVFERSLRRSKF